MSWFVKYLTSSIGKKQCMAVSGLLLSGYLVIHLAGNCLVFLGREAFNEYAAGFKANLVFLYTAEVILAGIFIAHIGLGALLTLENRRARGSRYAVKGTRGARTFASYTMFPTGLIVLVFLIVHLINFRFADLSRTTLYDVLVETFASFGYVAFYVFSSCVLGVHLWHGVQSAAKSLGLDHPVYTPYIEALGKLFAVVMAAGYSSVPIWVYFFVNAPGRTP
jgi:succinate dehydrogenase / fumarate reductase cytochrome b subunit